MFEGFQAKCMKLLSSKEEAELDCSAHYFAQTLWSQLILISKYLISLSSLWCALFLKNYVIFGIYKELYNSISKWSIINILKPLWEEELKSLTALFELLNVHSSVMAYFLNATSVSPSDCLIVILGPCWSNLCLTHKAYYRRLFLNKICKYLGRTGKEKKLEKNFLSLEFILCLHA